MSNPSVEPGLVFRPSVTSDVDGGLFGYIPLIELHRRTTAFADATGIAPMDLVRSRLVNMPIPFYPADWETGMRRWQGVDAAAMWHPLMWLPDAVATRYVTDGHVEDDDSWAVRVAYEATSRGVYDPETGMWQT